MGIMHYILHISHQACELLTAAQHLCLPADTHDAEEVQLSGKDQFCIDLIVYWAAHLLNGMQTTSCILQPCSTCCTLYLLWGGTIGKGPQGE